MKNLWVIAFCLLGCRNNDLAGSKVVLTENIVCSSECPIFRFENLDKGSFDGAGHTITRKGPSSNPLISVISSSNIVIKNLTIVEDTASCLPDANCPSTVAIEDSNQVTLVGLTINSGPAYVLTILNSTRVLLQSSEIKNAGIIGYYARNSNNLGISFSNISKARTNAIVLDNVQIANISNNIINDNHYHGLWNNPDGTIVNGGQVNLVSGTNITFTSNEISGGFCENCANSMVWGIELSTLTALTIQGNHFLNIYGVGVWLNTGNTLDYTSTISQNYAENVTSFLSSQDYPGYVVGPVISDNVVK